MEPAALSTDWRLEAAEELQDGTNARGLPTVGSERISVVLALAWAFRWGGVGVPWH